MKFISNRAFSFAETDSEGLFTGRHFTMYPNVPTDAPDWIFQTQTFKIESETGAIQAFVSTATASEDLSMEALEPSNLSEVETDSEES